MITKNKWMFFLLFILILLPLKFGFFILPIIACNVIIAFSTALYDIKFSFFYLPILFLTTLCIGGYTLVGTVCLHILPSFAIGKFIKNKSSLSMMLIVSTIISLVAFVVQTLLITKELQVEPSVWLFKNSIDSVKNFLIQNGTLDAEKKDFIFMQLNSMSKMLESMLPFLYITVALIFVYLIFNVTRFFLERKVKKSVTMPYFYQLWLPNSVNVIFVLLFLVSIFVESFVLMNVISVVFMLHVVCGIATMDAYMRKFGLSKGIRILILGVLLALSSLLGGFITTILCYLGMSGRKNVE